MGPNLPCSKCSKIHLSKKVKFCSKQTNEPPPTLKIFVYVSNFGSPFYFSWKYLFILATNDKFHRAGLHAPREALSTLTRLPSKKKNTKFIEQKKRLPCLR